MPIYEYRCAQCGHQQEVLQKVSDAPLTQCPKCNQPALAKMVTAAGFQLKGSGWYATDFKSKSSPAKADAKPDSGGDAKGGDSKGGDSKGGESKGEPKAAAAAGCGTGCACH